MTIATGIALASPVLASLVFVFGVMQFVRAQNWTRTEFAWKMVDRLTEDQDLALCRVLMDWSPRRIRIPERYVELMKDDEKRIVFTHTWDKLWTGLTKTEKFSFEEVMYRDLFDAFFSYLNEIERSLSTGLVTTRDLTGITYWIHKVASCKVLADGPLVFKPYVKHYYPGVEALMERYKISWATAKVDLQVDADAPEGSSANIAAANDESWQ